MNRVYHAGAVNFNRITSQPNMKRQDKQRYNEESSTEQTEYEEDKSDDESHDDEDELVIEFKPRTKSVDWNVIKSLPDIPGLLVRSWRYPHLS